VHFAGCSSSCAQQQIADIGIEGVLKRCEGEMIDEAGYERLAALRAGIRTYLAWAEQRAREHDMTPAQVQLALAIRAHDDADGPSVTELADTLLLRHHSVVGLIDRAEHAGSSRARGILSIRVACACG
jgi:MarR family